MGQDICALSGCCTQTKRVRPLNIQTLGTRSASAGASGGLRDDIEQQSARALRSINRQRRPKPDPKQNNLLRRICLDGHRCGCRDYCQAESITFEGCGTINSMMIRYLELSRSRTTRKIIGGRKASLFRSNPFALVSVKCIEFKFSELNFRREKPRFFTS